MRLPLDHSMIIEVSGSDAVKIVHNLTTNNIQRLSPGAAVESFITDVRGWVVAHGLVWRRNEVTWWVVGQHPEPFKVASHFDRYIIREEAQVMDRSADLHLAVSDAPVGPAGDSVCSIPLPSFGPTWQLHADFISDSRQVAPDDLIAWDAIRIPRGWPVMGRDIWEKCIPQELDRTEQAICFTKGCYLGQETIARLDALGQIQKKLCVLKIESADTKPEAPVFDGEKQVGHVTSVVHQQDSSLALVVLRRGYFEPGTKLTCVGAAAEVRRLTAN